MGLFCLFRICCCCSSQACTSANSRTASNGWMDGTGRPAINLFLVVADGSADGRSRPYIRNHPSACLVRSRISMLNAFSSRVCCSNAAIWRGIETLEKCATWENPVRLAERAFLSDKPPVTKTQLAPVRRRVQFRHPKRASTLLKEQFRNEKSRADSPPQYYKDLQGLKSVVVGHARPPEDIGNQSPENRITLRANVQQSIHETAIVFVH